MTSISDFTKHNLNEQGFDNLDDAAKSRYAWPLRFTPGVSIILIAIRLVNQLDPILADEPTANSDSQLGHTQPYSPPI